MMTSPFLTPDGVRFYVPWYELEVGCSVFVPCINVVALQKQLVKKAKDLGIRIRYETRVENGIFGLRFWRVD